MNLSYVIEFHTDWHCGSGLAAGADVDTLVVRDKDNLPFVPGKTIKGLLKEAMVDIYDCEKNNDFEKAFGVYVDSDTLTSNMQRGAMYFTNAELAIDEQLAICSNNLQQYLYRDIAHTAIENGIAVEHSLRKLEVVLPCKLQGQILNVPDDMVDRMGKAMNYIKRLGLNRNRGLGRCTLNITKIEKGSKL